MKVAVLGGLGLMGEAAVFDLCRQPWIERVVVADRDLGRREAVLAKLPRKEKAAVLPLDLTDAAACARALRGVRALVCAAWYELNWKAMDVALALGAHYVDLGGLYHMTLRQLRRNAEFRKAGILGILGCGSAPGITNMMAARLSRGFDAIRDVGIFDASHDPELREDGFSPPFSIRTMIAEHELPAPVLEGGRLKRVPANSLEEALRFPAPIGRCAAAAVIHSELATLPGYLRGQGVRNMSFKIAYPNVVKSQLAVLSAMGLGSKVPVQVRGVPVAPIELLAALARRGAAASPARPGDFEVLRVRIAGTRGGRDIRVTQDCELRPCGPLSAGAAGVGFSAAIAACMALQGRATRLSGVFAPESCLEPDLFFEEWKARRILTVKERRYGARRA